MKTKAVRRRESAKGQAGQGFSASRENAPAPKSKIEKTPAIPPKWLWHYRTLLRLRDHLMRDATTKRQEAEAPIEPHGTHMADSATDEFDHDLALTLLAWEENALSEVNDAITRLLDGTYGVCQETGMPIPVRRLRAIPWCRYGREVEERLEKTGTAPKARIPELASIRGPSKDIPDTGSLPREGMENEPRDDKAGGAERMAEPNAGPGGTEADGERERD